MTRPYVAVRRIVPADGFPAAVDDAFPRLFAWLAEEGVDPQGPPFVRYHGESADGYEVDLGVPVTGVPPEVPDGFVGNELPSGRYGVLTHVGPYDALVGAHAALDEWAAASGQVQDEAAGARVEHYVTDPRVEPDPTRLRVDVEQLLA